MLTEFRAAGAGPGAGKPFALVAFIPGADFGNAVVLFEGVLAETFEIVGAMGRNIVKTSAFALRGLTGDLLTLRVQVLMIFEFMVAEAFGFWTDHLALLPFGIHPTQIQPVFALL